MNDEKRGAKEALSRMQEGSKKQKRVILTVLVCAVGVMALLLGAVALIVALGKNGGDVPQGDYEFYPVYEGDIMENEEYLGLNRHVEYCSDPSGYGLKMSITDENREEFDESVLFLYDYIQTIIRGDSVAYNKMFHVKYFEDNEQKDAFSQQMLHEIKIRFLSESKQGEERLITYRLEYMIHRNDGTFRRDVGSDASRPQDITVRVGTDGKILIERLVTIYSKQ